MFIYSGKIYQILIAENSNDNKQICTYLRSLVSMTTSTIDIGYLGAQGAKTSNALQVSI
jgi:hypothetical protein